MQTRIAFVAIFLLLPASTAAQDSSAGYTKSYEQKALEIFRTSISFRTAQTHGNVPALSEYLADQFRAGGFADEDIDVLPLTLESGEETAVWSSRKQTAESVFTNSLRRTPPLRPKP